MSIDETVSFSLELNVEEAYTQVRRLETVLSRSLGIISRLTGSENIKECISVMQRAIAVANQLRLALAALQAARMASGDPLAWAMAGLSVASFGMSAGDLVEIRRSTY